MADTRTRRMGRREWFFRIWREAMIAKHHRSAVIGRARSLAAEGCSELGKVNMSLKLLKLICTAAILFAANVAQAEVPRTKVESEIYDCGLKYFSHEVMFNAIREYQTGVMEFRKVDYDTALRRVVEDSRKVAVAVAYERYTTGEFAADKDFLEAVTEVETEFKVVANDLPYFLEMLNEIEADTPMANLPKDKLIRQFKKKVVFFEASLASCLSKRGRLGELIQRVPQTKVFLEELVVNRMDLARESKTVSVWNIIQDFKN